MEPWLDRGPDNCDTAGEILIDPSSGEGSVSGTTEGLPRDDFSDTTCGGGGAPDVVYRISVPSSGLLAVELDTLGQWDGTVMLRGATCTSSTELNCARMPDASTFTELVSAGDHHLIVDGATADQFGDFDLFLTLDTQVVTDADTCAAPGEIDPDPATGSVTILGDTSGVAADYESCTLHSSCLGSNANDQVYSFTLNDRAPVRLTLDDAGNFDSLFYLRSDCTDETSVLASIDDPEPQIIPRWLDAGEYFVFVDGWTTGSGPYLLTVDLEADGVMENNTCPDAETIDLSGGSATVTGDTNGATNDDRSTCASSSYARDVVYKFELQTPSTVNVTLTADDWDAAISLRSTCDDVGTEAACVDSGSDDVREISEDLDAGTWYLWVDSDGAAERGPYTLEITLP